MVMKAKWMIYFHSHCLHGVDGASLFINHQENKTLKTFFSDIIETDIIVCDCMVLRALIVANSAIGRI